MWWRQTLAVIVGQQFWPFTNLSSNNELHAVFTFYLFYTLLRCLSHFIVSCTSSLTSSWVVAVLAKDLCSTRLRTKVFLHALPFVTFLKTCWLWLVWKCMMLALLFMFSFGLHSPTPHPPIHPLLYITVALLCKCFCPVVWEEGVAHFAICCLPRNLLALTGLQVHDVPFTFLIFWGE